jgi:hypothetical protein
MNTAFPSRDDCLWNSYSKNCVDKDDCPAYDVYNCRHWIACQFCPEDNSCVPFDSSHQEFGCPTPSPTPAPIKCRVCKGSIKYNGEYDYCFEDQDNPGKF